jgi:hypothetical protein
MISARENATYRCLFGEEMMRSSTDAQKSTEAFARRAEQKAKRDAIVKARLQAEADSIDAKTMRLRALRMAKEEREPGLIAFEGLAATGLERVSARLTTSQ